MSYEMWSWFLTAYNVLGMWITGRWRRAGWTVMILGGIPWAFYGLLTQQDGWLVGNLIFLVVYVRNWKLTVHEEQISQ
jgi:hypothetical protein